ncbi:MAG TPA: Crp/Fnr family transcriptional regulator [Candidatus Elarobacter sp.]|nr:Crp/Fnr family transcriptional regulator [Candidatus Elarobacter sp.]
MPAQLYDGVASGNIFLDTLRRTAAGAQLPADIVALHSGDVLEEPGTVSHFVFFPIHSLISITAQMEDGAAVEVGMVGREGMSGLSGTFGVPGAMLRTVVQIGDSAYRVAADALHDAFEHDRGVRELTLAYASYSFAAAAQFAACNGVHVVEERYARWLLMAHDRIASGNFTLTQEYSAQMLGVRRASITVIAGRLKEAGLIDYDRGHVRVRNHVGLSVAACECYDAVNAELKRMTGFDITL